MAGPPPPPGAHPGPPPPPPLPASSPTWSAGPPPPPTWSAGPPPPRTWPGGPPPPGWGYIAPNHATRLGATSAGFGERLAALLIDGLILFAVSIPLWVLGIVLVVSRWETHLGTCTGESGVETICDVPDGGTVAWLLLTVFGGMLAMLVATIFYWGKFEGERGQTPGKKALGIRVVDQTTGRPIGFGRAVGRMFARYLSSQVVYLGYLWMLWDDNQQTWHDKIVRSIVVKDRGSM